MLNEIHKTLNKKFDRRALVERQLLLALRTKTDYHLVEDLERELWEINLDIDRLKRDFNRIFESGLVEENQLKKRMKQLVNEAPNNEAEAILKEAEIQKIAERLKELT